MKRKKKQDHETNLEVILLSILVVGMFVMFFGMLAVDREQVYFDKYSTMQFLSEYINDGNITTEEFSTLKGLSCDDLKMLLGTEKEVCIYFRDSEGNIIDISSDGSYGVGCPGLEINGQKICNRMSR